MIKQILEESGEYYRDLDRRLRSRLAELPRGSLIRRAIGRNTYYYLVFRDGKRVVSRYIGKDKPVQLEKSIEERRLIRRQLTEVAANRRILRRLEGRKTKARSGRRERSTPPRVNHT